MTIAAFIKSGSEPLEARLLAQAQAIAELSATNARQTEQDRRVSDQIVQAMRAAGFYRILQPERWGGFEADFDLYSKVVRRVSQGDGSVGWTLMTGSIHQWLIGLFPEQAQQDIWGNGNGDFAAGSYAPSGRAMQVDGGFRISGSWSFASGCDTSDWLLLGALFQQSEGEAVKAGFFLTPKSDYTIDHSSWNTAGLSGSGSKNVHLKDAFIPKHRVLYFSEAASGEAPGTRINANPLYRIPFMACVPICLVSPAIGMAEGALNTFVETTKVTTTRGAVAGGAKSMADFQTVQIRVAEASASIDAAICLLGRDIAETQQLTRNGEPVDVGTRIRNRRDHAFCAKLAISAVDAVFQAAGGRALDINQPLQRYWRDIHAAGVHISLNWDAAGSMYGQYALGLEPQGQY